jgi:GDSL-like Lipase/Acylhydrolase
MARAIVAVLLLLAAAARADPPAKLSVAGDSMSQAAMADGWPGDRLQYSWAFGTASSVFSVLSRYQTFINGGVTAEPVSRDGATMIRDVGPQVAAICGQAVRPNRVFIALGQNDACNSRPSYWWQSAAANMPSAVTFATALHAALTQLEGCLPAGSVVQVVSVVRVDFLYGAGLSKDPVYCPLAWTVADICRIVTREPLAYRRNQIGRRIDEWNQAIAYEVESFDRAGLNPSGIRFITDWEGSIGAGHANTSVGTYRYGAGDINAFDCFHPSTAGQRKIACIEAAKSLDGIGNVAAPSDCFR